MTNTMTYKIIALIGFIIPVAFNLGLTGSLAVAAYGLGVVGSLYIALQLLRGHLQATVETYNPPVNAGIFRKSLEWLKAFFFT